VVDSPSPSAQGDHLGPGPAVPSDPPFRYPAATPDGLTRGLTLFTSAIMVALIVGGSVQTMVGIFGGDAGGVVRGLAFAALGLAVIALVAARFPVAYVLEPDAVHGTLLVVERRRFAPVRLVLSRYEKAESVRRVVFPWVPLLSGSRLFGLRGGRFEEMVAGFWSFGCDGRRAIVLSGPGRPRTLISPADPRGLLEGMLALPDTAVLVSTSPPEGDDPIRPGKEVGDGPD
jgi:hypothetical protein